MDEATWALVENERLDLAALLAGLTPTQWHTRSLCSQWRVRDVAAHLAMTPARAPSVATMTRALWGTRGDLWAAGRDVAIAYAERPCDRIVDEIRRGASSRAMPRLVSADNILLDLVVHGQDIAVPLGIDRPVPGAAASTALARIWGMGWPFHARRRLRSVRLRADDCGWTAGDGQLVHGAAGDLLLLTTGRTAVALERLAGPGVDLLREATLSRR